MDQIAVKFCHHWFWGRFQAVREYGEERGAHNPEVRLPLFHLHMHLRSCVLWYELTLERKVQILNTLVPTSDASKGLTMRCAHPATCIAGKLMHRIPVPGC